MTTMLSNNIEICSSDTNPKAAPYIQKLQTLLQAFDPETNATMHPEQFEEFLHHAIDCKKNNVWHMLSLGNKGADDHLESIRFIPNIREGLNNSTEITFRRNMFAHNSSEKEYCFRFDSKMNFLEKTEEITDKKVDLLTGEPSEESDPITCMAVMAPGEEATARIVQRIEAAKAVPKSTAAAPRP